MNPQHPATLYRHGVVHSSADPFAEAVLVADGQIAWLGPDDAADRLVDQVDEVVDLDGALVAPAFVDAHAHVGLAGLATNPVDLTGLDRDAVLDAVARSAEPLVVGVGWSPSPHQSSPTPAELTRAGAGRSVVLLDADLGRAQGSADLRSDDAAEPLVGLAVGSLLDTVAGSTPDAVRRGLAAAAAAGIVAVHEHSLPALEARAVLADLLAWSAADPTVPLAIGYRAELCETADDVKEVAADIPGLTGVGGDVAVDGTFAAWGAALGAPYADDPESRGRLLLSAEQVANHVGAATRAGVQAALRVHGDRAMAEALVGIRAASDVEGIAALNTAGHRLDGVELVDAAALASLVLLGLRAVVQPAEAERRLTLATARLGTVRAAGVLPLADLAAAGVPLGVGSGALGFDPWAAIRAAVLHREADQRISARAAFRAHTRGGWRLAGLDGQGVGEIRIGAPAHLALWRAEELVVQAPEGRLAAWSTDPRAGTPLLPALGPDLPAPVCLRTLRAGTVIHDALD
ncbi:amidohydrolase family protein [Isoptericola sp. b441]|uniref:Amidohydrolase family protein n=1 Tax=Actinotalea lenta TaxID=3064654 RepID=A0ABT9DA14_9CELL|nr:MULTISPECIES: amidohydrolase family protein [unclassified Isoptericola]MDO8107747.1 amidohydrolase family protein [Isoptericola sp. b441]MDO8120582.1 amidohydrolase family protein [Isoptericola sp. b490]